MSAFGSAKDKVDSYMSFEDLPRDRKDDQWTEIRNNCNLSPGEFSALRNNVCFEQGQTTALFKIPFSLMVLLPFLLFLIVDGAGGRFCIFVLLYFVLILFMFQKSSRSLTVWRF